MALPSMWFNYGDNEEVVCEDDGTYDLRFTCLAPAIIRLNGKASLVDPETGKTKFKKAGLQKRLGSGHGDSEADPIKITGASGAAQALAAEAAAQAAAQGRTATGGAAGDLVTHAELAARLRNLQMATVKGPAHSTSYEQFYANLKVGEMELKNLLSQNLTTIEEEDESPTLPNKDVVENDVMLPGFLKELQSLRSAGGKDLEYTINDTHNQQYLSGCRPDITVLKRGTVVSGFNAIFVIELQRGNLDNLHRGKALRYCELLMEANAARGFAMCLLTNMEVLEVYKVRRTPNKDLVHERSNAVEVRGGGGWAYIKNLLQQGRESLGYSLPVLVLDGKKHEPDGFLGVGHGVEVYQVQCHGQPMVCKVHAETRKRSFDRELAALEALRNSGTAPGSSLWPTLAACNKETWLLLTGPVVDPLEFWTCAGLHEMFLGLRHFHTVVKWVHRDLEPKHIGRARVGMHMCLYDLSSAAPLPGGDLQTASRTRSQRSPSQEDYYAGTILYASDDVLDAVASRRSCPVHVKQDLVPLVKSVYIMMHASASADIMGLAEHVQRLMPEGRHAVDSIKGFWDKELSAATPGGNLWREMLALASTDHMQAAESYANVTNQLRDKMACMLRGADQLPHVFGA